MTEEVLNKADLVQKWLEGVFGSRESIPVFEIGEMTINTLYSLSLQSQNATARNEAATALNDQVAIDYEREGKVLENILQQVGLQPARQLPQQTMAQIDAIVAAGDELDMAVLDEESLTEAVIDARYEIATLERACTEGEIGVELADKDHKEVTRVMDELKQLTATMDERVWKHELTQQARDGGKRELITGIKQDQAERARLEAETPDVPTGCSHEDLVLKHRGALEIRDAVVKAELELQHFHSLPKDINRARDLLQDAQDTAFELEERIRDSIVDVADVIASS